ncbi:hypothetical protein BDQ12DRAFT_671773 [Crucibulum laeve]|uniref:Uncharacterized protein n=1 Tax=Crucibulum laeve TaxID=68775 RepID=A0A5C3LEP1_9AGAR|nr:hypothetical protein BDQ12DRAFT_671773 [Crucibulum laeve]
MAILEAPPPLTLRGCTITEVESYKYLGMHINKKLYWNIQANNMIEKATKHVVHPTAQGGQQPEVHWVTMEKIGPDLRGLYHPPCFHKDSLWIPGFQFFSDHYNNYGME